MTYLFVLILTAVISLTQTPADLHADDGVTTLRQTSINRASARSIKKKCRKRIRRKARTAGWSKTQQKKRIRRCIKKQEQKEGSSEEASLAFIQGIAEARNLFIAPQSPTARSSDLVTSDATTALFSVRTDGFVSEVAYTDTEGAALSGFRSSQQPVGIFRAGTDYTLATFKSHPYLYATYLTRRTDGAVFLIDGGIAPNQVDNTFTSPVQLDNDGNVYFVTREAFRLVRIDISDPANLTLTDYLIDTESTWNFLVDSDGNAAYNSLGNDAYRIRKASGGYKNFPPGLSGIWVGPDGKFRFTHDDSLGSTTVNEVRIDEDGTVSFVEVASLNASYYNSTRVLSSRDIMTFASTSIIPANSGVYVFNYANDTLSVLQGSTPDHFPLRPTQWWQSDEYYYLYGTDTDGNSRLLRVDPATHSFDDVYSPGKYVVYKLTVTDNEVLTLNVLRLSDGVKVLVQLDAEGQETVLDEVMNVEVSNLIPLN